MNVVVYMTAPNHEEARSIGAALVAQRLAACVNILGPISSLFRWDGKVQDENEVAFIAKTTEEAMPRLTEAVRTMHSYDVPCIVAVPIVAGHDAFLNWIQEETAG